MTNHRDSPTDIVLQVEFVTCLNLHIESDSEIFSEMWPRFSSLLTLCTAPSMFRNLCLVLLLQLAGSLVPKFLSFNEKKRERSPGNGLTWSNLADGVTTLALLFYVLYSNRARSFNQW